MAQLKEKNRFAGSSLIKRSTSLLLLGTNLLASVVAYGGYADNAKLAMMENLLVFTDGGRLVTLTNNHQLLPTTCRFKGRTSSNRKLSELGPIDPVTAMIWYIETSRKHQANYLLANARYESLWAYQCALHPSPTIQADS